MNLSGKVNISLGREGTLKTDLPGKQKCHLTQQHDKRRCQIQLFHCASDIAENPVGVQK